MSKYIVLYNPLSKKCRGEKDAKRIEKVLPAGSEIEYKDGVQFLQNFEQVYSLPEDTRVVFTGGDGTVNRVVNLMLSKKITHPVYYFPAGSGNDFIRDIGKDKNCEPFLINDYIHHLPVVEVNGERLAFVNGIGAGLDGYCCEESDRLRALGKDRSYTMIAFLGLIRNYQPVTATVTVDGVTKTFERVYMAPTMFGRYYGGGVLITPQQDRNNEDYHVTSGIIFCKSRLRGLLAFLGICKGKGPKMPSCAYYQQGHSVTVEFASPVSLQVDGETILNVTKYTVEAQRP